MRALRGNYKKTRCHSLFSFVHHRCSLAVPFVLCNVHRRTPELFLFKRNINFSLNLSIISFLNLSITSISIVKYFSLIFWSIQLYNSLGKILPWIMKTSCHQQFITLFHMLSFDLISSRVLREMILHQCTTCSITQYGSFY